MVAWSWPSLWGGLFIFRFDNRAQTKRKICGGGLVFDETRRVQAMRFVCLNLIWLYLL